MVEDEFDLVVLSVGLTPSAGVQELASAAAIELGDNRFCTVQSLAPGVVLSRHVLRNVALPVLTSINSSMYFSLSSLLVVEWLFNWSGIGLQLLEAVSKRDAETASYLLVSVGLTMLLINTVVKIVMRHIDPRVAESESVIS